MKPLISPFGDLADGSEVLQIRLTGHGQNLDVITWGAVVRDLRISVGAIENRRVVLGLNSLEDYLHHSPHFGAIAGRCANRIANGRFELDGQSYQLTKNQTDVHHLHGGRFGFGKRNWTLVESTDNSVTLQLISDDGDEGYPGKVTAQCTYSIIRINQQVHFQVDLSATTTQPTLVNLAQHSYFNLDQTADVRDHKLKIQADGYLPTDRLFIPTGEIFAVLGTDYDFQKPRTVGSHGPDGATTYDNNFIVASVKRDNPVAVATLSGNRGLAMDVISGEPGLQFYDGSRVNVPVDGICGVPYGAFAGVCLEPQIWPDSANHPTFPSAVLRPSETYQQRTSYLFQPT